MLKMNEIIEKGLAINPSMKLNPAEPTPDQVNAPGIIKISCDNYATFIDECKNVVLRVLSI